MRLCDFFAVTEGRRKLCLTTQIGVIQEKPMCGMDFWHRYGGKPVWKEEIDRVTLIAERDAKSEEWDKVICVIKMKEKKNEQTGE